MMNQDTICAIATAQGGAIGTIRVSGADAITITDKIFFPFKSSKTLDDQAPYTLTFGQIKDQDEVIDEVLVSLFKNPHSYTGENSTEISCHGSNYILQKVMELLIQNGCRTAQSGEFTQRAFMNGKMDLSQAEAVADLIASTSAATHKLAMSQMRGGFSKELAMLRNELLHITSMVELELDFSEEDVEFANRDQLKELSNKIATLIEKLTKSFSLGNAIKNGIPVAIIGETNAGKSTLLNTLLNEEKAIVSNIHGTTRDVIEDTMNIGGVTFRFIDTAGIRDTQDTIESIGIERTFQKLDRADIVLWVVDVATASEQFKELSDKIIPRTSDKQLVLLLNKAEDIPQDKKNALSKLINDTYKGLPHLFISAKEKEGIDELEKLLIDSSNIPNISQNDVIVTNVRHYEALVRALEAINRVRDGLDMQISGDFLSQDIRECIHHLNDIAGEVTNDMVLQNIFKNFCIGK